MRIINIKAHCQNLLNTSKKQFIPILAAACLSSATNLMLATPSMAAPMKLSFNDSEFLHRWSQNNQNEFTPQAQSDLNAWQDMITINVYPTVKTGEHLSGAANATVGNYQAHGKILRTNSKERTASKPAEHLIVALLGDGKMLEAVFARFVLVDDTGCAVIYSHRVYGDKAGGEMSKWLKDNGAGIEQRLMSFDKIPTAKMLSGLPQSK